jgi:hypothetical protein
MTGSSKRVTKIRATPKEQLEAVRSEVYVSSYVPSRGKREMSE